MIVGYHNEQEIVQNMVDAGCSEETISQVLACLKQGQQKESLHLLREQREELLKKIHRDKSGLLLMEELIGNVENK